MHGHAVIPHRHMVTNLLWLKQKMMTDSEGQAVDPQQEPVLTRADIPELVRLLVDEVSKRILQADKSRDDPREGPSTRPEEGE